MKRLSLDQAASMGMFLTHETPVKDCIINTIFTDAKNVVEERAKYCRKNCQFKCLNGQDYKKIEG